MRAGELSSSLSIDAGRCMLSLAQLGIEAAPAAAEYLGRATITDVQKSAAESLFVWRCRVEGTLAWTETCWARMGSLSTLTSLLLQGLHLCISPVSKLSVHEFSSKAVSHGVIVPIAAFTVRLKLRTMDLYMAPLTQVGVSTGSPASRIYTA
jgi:hypothetical protein